MGPPYLFKDENYVTRAKEEKEDGAAKLEKMFDKAASSAPLQYRNERRALFGCGNTSAMHASSSAPALLSARGPSCF